MTQCQVESCIWTSSAKKPTYGLGFRVWGLGFRDQGLGFRDYGLGIEAWGLGFLGHNSQGEVLGAMQDFWSPL